RTKQGDENSYISSDDINAIDMSFKTKYIDVYNVYKGLIALRHTYDAFTAGTNVTAERVSEGLIKYTVSGTNGDFCVYFNATAGDKSITATGYTKVIDVTDGTLQESETLPTNVGATNFVILKK
ncbi:MAG: alpha-amylase, partial [Spirochaetales bacterium]|nr:alpha-amylase [Spirochaetales bacterium]